MKRERGPRLAAVVNPDWALLELQAKFRDLETKIEELPEETPDEVIEAFVEPLVALRMQIAETPAQGISGIVVKLRQVLATITEYGSDIRSTEWDEPALRTALDAAERLARGAHVLTHDNGVKRDRPT